MSDPLLSVEALTVERGGRVVLERLGFTLCAGETILVSGRNGVGKSTLLRTLSGLLAPASGRIVYALATEEVRGVETVHYFGYDDALKPSLTVGENLDFWAEMLRSPLFPAGRVWGSGGQSQTTVRPALDLDPSSSLQVARMPANGVPPLTPDQALAAFGIARLVNLPAAYLSAGQKRRVALARLLIAPRQIWLLDEPLIALDVGAQAILTAIMADHVARGGATVVASHQPLALRHREIVLSGALT